MRRTASRVAAPVVWLLAGAGLLLVAGDPHRPWVSGRVGPAANANPPVFAWLSFSPGAPLTRTLREDGLHMGFAGPPRPLAADEQRPEFAPPPDELWPPGWGVDGFVYDARAPGVAQRAASLRFSGWFLGAFSAAFAAVRWTIGFFLRKRREGRGERIESDRRPGWFGLLRGVLKPWVLLAAVAGAAEVSTPLATLAECAGAGPMPVSAGIVPPWPFGGLGDAAGEPRGLAAGVSRAEPTPAPPAGAGRRAAPPEFRVLSNRTVGRGGWRLAVMNSRVTKPGRRDPGRGDDLRRPVVGGRGRGVRFAARRAAVAAGSGENLMVKWSGAAELRRRKVPNRRGPFDTWADGSWDALLSPRGWT